MKQKQDVNMDGGAPRKVEGPAKLWPYFVDNPAPIWQLFSLYFLNSSRLAESFVVFSFVFEAKMEILAKITAKKWRGNGPLAPTVPTPKGVNMNFGKWNVKKRNEEINETWSKREHYKRTALEQNEKWKATGRSTGWRWGHSHNKNEMRCRGRNRVGT